MGTQVRTFAKFIVFVLVSLLILELGSKGILYYALGIHDSDYTHYYQNDPQLRMITWTEGYSPHPYFGYESSTTRASEKTLLEASDDDFVIGILGGSVVGSFAEYSIRNPGHFELLRKVIHQSEALRKTPAKEMTERLIAIWKKYTILEDDLLRKRGGKPVYFFLQPNQYLKESKPLSEEEQRVAIDPQRLEGTHEMMTLLKAAVQDLQRSGVPPLISRVSLRPQ